MRRVDGFTLIEFAVSVGILTVLAGVAAPMMRSFIVNARVSATANDFYGMVQLARAEAIRRGARVTFCGLQADGSCLQPSGTSVPYESYGWAVFEDTSVGSSNLLGSKASPTKLVRVQNPPPTGIMVRTNFAYATFTPMGMVRMDGVCFGGTAKVCNGFASNTACDTTTNVRCLRVSSGGSSSLMIPTGSAAGLLSAGPYADDLGGGCV